MHAWACSTWGLLHHHAWRTWESLPTWQPESGKVVTVWIRVSKNPLPLKWQKQVWSCKYETKLQLLCKRKTSDKTTQSPCVYYIYYEKERRRKKKGGGGNASMTEVFEIKALSVCTIGVGIQVWNPPELMIIYTYCQHLQACSVWPCRPSVSHVEQMVSWSSLNRRTVNNFPVV